MFNNFSRNVKKIHTTYSECTSERHEVQKKGKWIYKFIKLQILVTHLFFN